MAAMLGSVKNQGIQTHGYGACPWRCCIDQYIRDKKYCRRVFRHREKQQWKKEIMQNGK